MKNTHIAWLIVFSWDPQSQAMTFEVQMSFLGISNSGRQPM